MHELASTGDANDMFHTHPDLTEYQADRVESMLHDIEHDSILDLYRFASGAIISTLLLQFAVQRGQGVQEKYPHLFQRDEKGNFKIYLMPSHRSDYDVSDDDSDGHNTERDFSGIKFQINRGSSQVLDDLIEKYRQYEAEPAPDSIEQLEDETKLLHSLEDLVVTVYGQDGAKEKIWFISRDKIVIGSFKRKKKPTRKIRTLEQTSYVRPESTEKASELISKLGKHTIGTIRKS